ncbi:LytTR family DNA-binding domain-containing protein [Pedobacter sp. PLR]|uniref:LytR/AlgR family response regulator transcription factor n=1 Tax=Pedobacter sp. PLR TaxID=2994465 RepID=UPI002246F198|nr:LytTR family DNA-binding domain-containing protein [Pedobacter sp. PLR]MCX2454170.1 LytTR family DNA-binding domain-containing protein [Pedobacter sp. PLR]
MKNQINCVIIDDDQFAIDILKDYIAEVPGLSLYRSYTNPVIALAELLEERNVHLLFLDINMPKLSGLQIAESLKHRIKNIVFTTAHSKYAIKAFDVQARHYFLKPIELSHFIKVVSSIITSSKTNSLATIDDESYFIHTGERGKLTRVQKKEIIYIQGAINYVDLFMQNRRYTIYMTMKEMEVVFKSDPRYFRVHKSYIINRDFVDSIIGNTIKLGEHQALMSSPYKNDFIKYLSQRTLLSKRL